MSIAQLNEVAVKRYGKPVIGLDALSALWLAEHILSTTGENVFRIISDFRHRYGLATNMPSFGTKLFETI